MADRHHIGALVAGGFSTGVAAFMLGTSPIDYAIAAGLGGMSYGLARKHGITCEECLDSVLSVGQESIEGLQAELGDIFPKNPIQSVVGKLGDRIPLVNELAALARQEQSRDTTWWDEISSQSKALVGKSKTGKTFTLRWEVYNFIQQHPEGQVIIVDLDYGSSHDGAEPNYWFHIPKYGTGAYRGKAVFTKAEAAVLAIAQVHALMTKRIDQQEQGKRPRNNPVLLVVDEAIAAYQQIKNQIGEDEAKEWMRQLADILQRGLKQKIRFTLGLHNLAVGHTGLDLAMLQQLNVILLGKSASITQNYSNLGVEKPKNLIEEWREVRQIPGCQFACVAGIDGEYSVKVLPQLPAISDDAIAWEEDDTDRWFKDTLTTELEMILTEIARANRNHPIKDVAAHFGIKGGSCVNSNPKYIKVKNFWASLTDAMYSGQNSEPRTNEPALEPDCAVV